MQHASWLFIAVIGVRQTSEKLGGISFKLETKIMNFMSVFFEKIIIESTQVLSIICNTICLQFSLIGPFADFGFVFIDFITYFQF